MCTALASSMVLHAPTALAGAGWRAPFPTRDTLQHCAVARARLLVAVRHGRHWHVLIPRNEDASARTWVLAESVRSLFMGGEAIDGARAAVRSATVA